MVLPKHQFSAQEIISKGYTTQILLDHMKQWWLLQASENFVVPQLTEEQLVIFLMSCDNNPDFTKDTIKAFFSCKKAGPELFDGRDMDAGDLRQASATVDLSVLPVRTPENYAIICGRLKDTTYYNFVLESCMKLLFMCLEMPLYSDPPRGVIVIFDMKGVGLMHLTRIKVGAVKKFFHYLQEALPCKLKDIHILNCVYFFDKIMAIIKPFMKKDLINMLHLHRPGTDMSVFFGKYVAADCMPEDYGGKLPGQASLSSQTYDKLRTMREFFLHEEVQRKTHGSSY